MAEPKVQLVAPIGNLTVPGMNVTGVVTATTIGVNTVGVAGSIIQGTNLDIGAGIITATSFVGDQIGTYRAASLTGSPDLVVGVVTSSGFVAPITGDVTGNLTGNVVGTAKSILSGNNLWVGIATATLVGPASNLVGVAASAFTHQTVTADGATTSIDLSAGNIITFDQSSNTTVSFANTSSAMTITLIRDKDDTSTARTITWPDSVKWNGGSAPTLVTNPRTAATQQFQFLTRDSGVTWYGWETMKSDPQTKSLFAWGGNPAGQLGLNTAGWPSAVSSPTQVGTLSEWQTILDGDNGQFNRPQCAAIKTDGSLWSWGNGDNGQLGLNDLVKRSSPTQIGSGTDWSSVWANYWNTGAIKTDGSLWVWGYNFYGDLGQNVGVPWPGPNAYLGTTSSPIQIPGTTWASVAGGSHYFLASKSDGTLWGWGLNDEGELGQNNGVKYSSPVQIPGTTWNSVSSSNPGVVVANKTDGSLWTWGAGSNGGLGQNNNATYSSPIQVGTDSTWNTFSAGYRSIRATKTDGTLWSWGSNTYGSLGLNNKTDYSSPMQVGTDTTWSGGGLKSRFDGYGFKTDGTLWGWGRNNTGIVNPDLTARSSPTQIPGTNWSGSISKTYWGVLALKDQ